MFYLQKLLPCIIQELYKQTTSIMSKCKQENINLYLITFCLHILLIRNKFEVNIATTIPSLTNEEEINDNVLVSCIFLLFQQTFNLQLPIELNQYKCYS